MSGCRWRTGTKSPRRGCAATAGSWKRKYYGSYITVKNVGSRFGTAAYLAPLGADAKELSELGVWQKVQVDRCILGRVGGPIRCRNCGRLWKDGYEQINITEPDGSEHPQQAAENDVFAVSRNRPGRSARKYYCLPCALRLNIPFRNEPKPIRIWARPHEPKPTPMVVKVVEWP